MPFKCSANHAILLPLSFLYLLVLAEKYQTCHRKWAWILVVQASTMYTPPRYIATNELTAEAFCCPISWTASGRVIPWVLGIVYIQKGTSSDREAVCLFWIKLRCSISRKVETTTDGKGSGPYSKYVICIACPLQSFTSPKYDICIACPPQSFTSLFATHWFARSVTEHPWTMNNPSELHVLYI